MKSSWGGSLINWSSPIFSGFLNIMSFGLVRGNWNYKGLLLSTKIERQDRALDNWNTKMLNWWRKWGKGSTWVLATNSLTLDTKSRSTTMNIMTCKEQFVESSHKTYTHISFLYCANKRKYTLYIICQSQEQSLWYPSTTIASTNFSVSNIIVPFQVWHLGAE